MIGVFELLADAREQVGSVNAAIEATRDFWLAETALQLALAGSAEQRCDDVAARHGRPRHRPAAMQEDAHESSKRRTFLTSAGVALLGAAAVSRAARACPKRRCNRRRERSRR